MPDPLIPHWRVMAFLEALRAVWLGTACLTPEGCTYFGVAWHFNAQSVTPGATNGHT